MSKATPTCLLDASVFYHAENTRPEWISQEFKWGGKRLTIPILAGMRRKEPAGDQLRSEVEKLYTVGQLAHEGRLRLYQSEEVWDELSGKRSSKNPAFPEGRPLAHCKIETVPSPVTRTRFSSEVLGLDRRPPPVKERIPDFCKRLLGLSSQQVEDVIAGLENSPQLRFPDFEKECLRGLPRFRQLCGNSGNHLTDCYHLWTAETNKLDLFLLLDFKFINFITSRRITPTVKMVTPRGLLSELGVIKTDPVPTGATILSNPRPTFENET